jgi:hypothetical protein
VARTVRVALPEDNYLVLNGQMADMVSSLEWTILGDLPGMAQYLPTDLTTSALAGKSTGQIAGAPSKAAKAITDTAWLNRTMRGMTSATTELDRMAELAHALQPAEGTPIRLPLSLPNLPDEIPLAQIDVDTHRDEPEKPDYGTMVDFPVVD